MAPAGKISGFYREGNEWFCKSSLPSDLSVVVDEVQFHLHKFPLISRCAKIATICEESKTNGPNPSRIALEEFPGGAETFLTIVKFCYTGRVEFAPRNIAVLYCAANFLDMNGEGNLLSKAESFFNKHALRNWKDCILALQSFEPVMITIADKLQIISRCLDALSVMVCTDPSLFGWPMKIYGSNLSPGGSILWNGINTGAKIQCDESDWWFEDVSYLRIELFERLIRTMQAKGTRPENLARAIMYYCNKYLPGINRWQGGQIGKSRSVASFSMTPVTVNQKSLLESVIKLFPDKKGESFCRFLLGILRLVLILGVDETCRDLLEKRIGTQLELATLDGLLIPNYSDSDTLYNVDCIERIIHHFVSSEPNMDTISLSTLNKVAKLVDDYIAEVASDANLKPGKLRSLAEALPECSRSLHDGLYRALDVYFKARPGLSEKDREQLCSIIDSQKLSIDACAHASQNERLPLRIVLQVLFFEQMQLRTALASCLHVLDSENAPSHSRQISNETAGQIVRKNGWSKVVRENEVLKLDMEKMRSRVGELEQEFNNIKEDLNKISKSHSSLSSPRFITKGIARKLLVRRSDVQRGDVCDSETTKPLTRHRKSTSVT